MEKFFEELADILDVDAVNAEEILEDFDEYDSLSILTIISLAGSKYGKTLTAQDVRACKTAQDLYSLVGD